MTRSIVDTTPGPARAGVRAIARGIVRVNGVELEYAEAGAGTPLVFVHGALCDLRVFLPHCERLADRRRAITYSQRWHGSQAWDPAWPRFGTRVHADDLAAFVEALAAGPVDVVAWSYGGHVALTVAVERPELVRRAYVYEPGVPTYVTDPAALAAYTEDGTAMFGPVFAAASEPERAVRALIDGSGGRAGHFETQPAEIRAMELAQARTIAPLLAQDAPPHLTCADLAVLRGRVVVAWGAATRPLFATVARAAAACIGGPGHGPVTGAGHLWPIEDPDGFAAAAVASLDR